MGATAQWVGTSTSKKIGGLSVSTGGGVGVHLEADGEGGGLRSRGLGATARWGVGPVVGVCVSLQPLRTAPHPKYKSPKQFELKQS